MENANKKISIKKHHELSEELLKNLSGFIFNGIYINRSSQVRDILFIVGKMGNGKDRIDYVSPEEAFDILEKAAGNKREAEILRELDDIILEIIMNKD